MKCTDMATFPSFTRNRKFGQFKRVQFEHVQFKHDDIEAPMCPGPSCKLSCPFRALSDGKLWNAALRASTWGQVFVTHRSLGQTLPREPLLHESGSMHPSSWLGAHQPTWGGVSRGAGLHNYKIQEVLKPE